MVVNAMSDMIGIAITGVPAVIKKLNKINKEFFESFIKDIADLTVDYAFVYAPEDTGNMENSIRALKTGDFTYDVICDVPYAEYNEYGSIRTPVPFSGSSTSGKSPVFRPFMRPAAIRARDEAGNIFKIKFEEWIS